MRSFPFGDLTIRYDARVLRPRAWTELQSRWAAELLADLPDGAVVELCCGAGHIGLLTASLTGRRLVQVDVDPGACELARENALGAGLGGQVTVVCCSLGGVSPDRLGLSEVPLVLADPPYVRSGRIGDFPEDPIRAIDGGSDGLAVIRAAVAAAERLLGPGGVLLLQVGGPAQADEVAREVATSLACTDVRVHDEARAVVALRALSPR